MQSVAGDFIPDREQQRSAVAATARKPLHQKPLTSGFRPLSPRLRGAHRAQDRDSVLFLLVKALRRDMLRIVSVFEMMLLPAPSAGFEPAHTAPETMCLHSAAPALTC
jgi:hypothetical protein